MSVGTGRQNIIILFWKTVSFLEIHKWQPDIYIGFSLAVHLQCTMSKSTTCNLKEFTKRLCLMVGGRLRRICFGMV
jgi:hypothetical protein